jgi:branched-chain amino acid transport system permease protein
MTLSTLAAGVVNGFFLGGLYAIAALGLALVFGVLRLVNVVHGDLLILAGYLSMTLSGMLGIDPLLTVLLVVPLMFLVGYPLQRWVFNPLMARGAEPPLLTAFGLSIIAQNLLLFIWRADTRTIQTSYTELGITLLGIRVPVIYLISFFLAVVLYAGVQWFISHTFLGRGIRAASQDAETASTLGMNPSSIYALTYGLGTATAAFGGALLAMTFSLVPAGGLPWLLKGFVVVVLGGMGSIRGALVAGLLLGAAEGLGGAIVGTGYRDMVGYLIFLIVLVFKPNGLFGRQGRLA